MAKGITPWGDGPTTGDLLFPGTASPETEAAVRLKTLIASPDGLPTTIDESLVTEALEGAFFRPIGNIIDPDVSQTTMRDINIGEHQIFEFSLWADETGAEKSRVLRIEVVEHDNQTPRERQDYELVDGVYVQKAASKTKFVYRPYGEERDGLVSHGGPSWDDAVRRGFRQAELLANAAERVSVDDGDRLRIKTLPIDLTAVSENTRLPIQEE